MRAVRGSWLSLLLVALVGCNAKGLIKINTGGNVLKPKSPVTSSGSSSGATTPDAPKPMAKGQGHPWCEGYTPSTSDSNATWARDYAGREGLTWQTLAYMAKASCDKPKDDARLKELATWKQAYAEAFGTTDADFAEAMAIYIKDSKAADELRKAQCEKFKIDKEADPTENVHAGIRRFALQCSDSAPDAAMWHLDRPTITEVERAVLVNLCIGRYDDEKVVNPAFAFCLDDMRKLDRAKLDKAIAKMGLNLYGRVMLRETWGMAKVKSVKLVAKYDELAKDGDWKRLFDAGQKGWQAWMDLYNANKASFELVKKFEEKVKVGSKKALAGCGIELRTAYFSHLKAGKPENADQARARATDAVGYPLLVALMTCDAAEGRLLEVATAYNVLFQGLNRPPRGPRFASYYATLGVLNDIRADRARFPLERLGYLPQGPNTAYRAYEETFNKVHHDRAEGQVESVKDNGDGTFTVTFKAVKWKEPVYKCRRTNRISRIDENGNLIYEEICKQTGYENKSSKEQPVVVAREFVEGLAAGQMLSCAVHRVGDKRMAVPVGVFGDLDKKKFLGFYGVVW